MMALSLLLFYHSAPYIGRALLAYIPRGVPAYTYIPYMQYTYIHK